MNFRAVLLITPVIALPLAAQDAAPPNLSAREIFYSSGPAPAAAKSARRRNSVPARKPPEAEREAAVASPPPAASRQRIPSAVSAPVLNAAAHPGKALGLRYTLVKVSDGSERPVGVHSVFHSGDRIKIDVQVNDAAYLYVISRGASGAWAPLFPSKDVADGSNRVEPGRTYRIPPGKVFTFAEPSGSERLFVVVSRQPEPSLEHLIYSVGSGNEPAPASPASDEKPKLLMASASIGDDTVGGLRTYSRDLIVEDAGEESTAPQASAAGAADESVYTVNPSGSADSRVVADITLRHE